MEKINFKSALTLGALVAVAGLMFFGVNSFYGEEASPKPTKTLLAQDTLLVYKFKSMHGYSKPANDVDSLVDKGCQPVDIDLIVLGTEEAGGQVIHFVFNMVDISTTDVFDIVATNPENGNQILVTDAYGRRLVFTMICNPKEDPMAGEAHSEHKHWLVTENLTEFTIYSTEDGECKFLRSDN